MALYSIARNGTATTSGNVAMDVATSTGARPRLMEWGLFLGAATASSYGLQRTTALGTRTSPVALAPEDPNDPALTGIMLTDCAVAFSVEPTESGTDLRRVSLPGAIGAGMVWTFPRGLVWATSLSLAIVNAAANANSLNGHIVVDQ